MGDGVRMETLYLITTVVMDIWKKPFPFSFQFSLCM
jgi:hypothetical protein